MTPFKTLFRAALLSSALAAPSFAADNPPAIAQQQQPTSARPVMDVVFVLDTTSSMGGLIEGAKQKIWSIASRMASGKPTPKIRVGLVGFRDRGDAYITKRFDLSDDLDAVYGNLQGFRAEGGGDGPEHVGQALGEAVSLMSWTQEPKTSRIIFLVGDAPGHDDYKDGWNTKVWAKNAIEKGIVVNTIRCGAQGGTEALFRELAKLADGSFVSIEQNGGMVAVATPFDDEMAKINAEIADKTLVAGTVAARAEGKVELDALKAMPASTSADRSSYRAKAMPAAPPPAPVRASGTVVLNAAPEKAAAMKDEELPAAVAALPKGEREGYVRKLNAEQQQLQTRLTELSKKRDSFIKSAPKKADSFDDKVFESVKRTAATNGVSYE